MATTHPTTTLTVREYLRVSQDGSGRERSNDEQHHENDRWLSRSGDLSWSDLPAYRDVGSASKFQTRSRDAFDQLISDLAGGRFGADVLLLWIGSRGSRKASEWITLVELCEENGVQIAVTTDDRMYDPASPRDRKSLLESAIDAEYDTAKISQMVRRAMRANAEAGLHHGGRRPYGYTHDGKHINADERAVILECVDRVLAGESARAIATDLNARQITTASGKAWHPNALMRILSGPRIVGQRIHHERIMETAAEWPAIIDIDTHRRLVAVFTSRSPVGRRGRTPWLLSGVLRCELCGGGLFGQQDVHGTRRYVCRKAPGAKGCGRLVIKADPVEQILGELCEERLADVKARRDAAGGPGREDEIGQLERIAAMRVEIATDYAAGLLSRSQRLEDVAALDRRQVELERALATKVHQSAPLDFVMTDGVAGRPWRDLETEEKRRIVTALVDHVEVGPTTRRGSTRFEPARVAAPGRIAWIA